MSGHEITWSSCPIAFRKRVGVRELNAQVILFAFLGVMLMGNFVYIAMDGKITIE